MRKENMKGKLQRKERKVYIDVKREHYERKKIEKEERKYEKGRQRRK